MTSEPLKYYTKAKRNQVRMLDTLATFASSAKADLVQPEVAALAKRAKSLDRCASWLKLREDIYSETRTDYHLIDGRFCGCPALCEGCARRSALRAVSTYYPRIQALLEGNQGPSRRHVILMTLTVQAQVDLRAGIDLVRESVAKARMNARLHHSDPRRKWSEFCRIIGGVSGIEVVPSSRPGHYHPHIHMLVVTDSYFDQAALSAEWKTLTGGSYIVDVREIRCKGTADEYWLRDGVVEALKYPAKFDSKHSRLNVLAYLAFAGFRHGRRINVRQAFGALRGLEVDETEEPDVPEWSPLSAVILAKWDIRRGAYDLDLGRVCSAKLVSAQRAAREAGDWDPGKRGTLDKDGVAS